MIPDLIKSIRPREWVKNGFVLAPLFFSGNLWNPAKYLPAAAAFIAFCLASSAVYLFNDVIDRENDRAHPLKQNRPIASGTLPVSVALRSAALLACGACLMGFSTGLKTGSWVAAYGVLMIAYCLFIKKIILLDVLTIATGFVIRAVAGATAISVMISPWLIACTFTLSLFLGYSKRLHELRLLKEEAGNHRSVLGDYSIPFLHVLLAIVAVATMVAYSLYVLFPVPGTPASEARMIWTIPFVLYGMVRYWYLSASNKCKHTPTVTLLTDWQLLVTVALWLTTAWLAMH